MQRLRHIIILLAVIMTAGGCTWRHDSTEGFYTTRDGITVTPDSIIGPDGDILFTSCVPVADVDAATRLSRMPRIITSSSILDALCYNELFAVGDSIDIDIDNIETALLLLPHSVATHGGQSVCRTVITDIMRYMAGVGADTSERLYNRGVRLMDALTDSTYDIRRQMYAGTPARYTRDMLPPWFDAADRRRLLSADIAADCHRALSLLDMIAPHDDGARLLPVSPDALAARSRTALWIPERGTLSAYLYAYPYPIQLPATDSRATAKAVIGGMLTPVMARTAVAMAPVTDTGMTTLSPLPPDADATPADATTAALRAVAACRVNNADARDHALAALMLGALDGTMQDHGEMPVTTAILRGILGISITRDGLAINPSVPSWLTANKTVTGLRYRDATLDITVRGTGNIISTFAIDNIAAREHLVPPDLTGRHSVTVTLTGATREHSAVNITDIIRMPAEPRITWRGTDAAIAPAPDTDNVTIYVDGELMADTDSRDYAAGTATRTRWYSFASVSDDGLQGFTTAPYPIIPQDAVTTLPASAVGTTGSRILADKVTVRRRRRTYTQLRPSKYEASTVESTVWHNATLTFTVDIGTPGLYAIDMLYLDGLGIVNADRGTTTRTVSINGRDAGILTFTQLSPDQWQPDADWRAHTAYSDMIIADLDAGTTVITIGQTPVNNGDDNLLLVKELRIIRL